MVIGHHLIWTAYGWWLPNDPRGSSSHEIRIEAIANLGELHYGRKPVQPSRHELRDFSQRARSVLTHPALAFDEEEIAIVAQSIATTIKERGYTCYACALMPDHAHLLIRRHRDWAEYMLAAFQENSRTALIAEQRRRGNHPVWGGPGWKVFKDTRLAMRQTVVYIEGNPDERGLPRQHWDFVTPYDDWPPGAD